MYMFWVRTHLQFQTFDTFIFFSLRLSNTLKNKLSQSAMKRQLLCVCDTGTHILLTCLLVTELTNAAPLCHNKYQDSRIGNVIVTIHRNYRIHSSLASLPFSAKMKWYEDKLYTFLVHFYWRFVYIKMCSHWKEIKKGLNVYPP